MNSRVFTSRTVFLTFGVCLLIWLALLPAGTSEVPSVDKPDYNLPLNPLDEHARTCKRILKELRKEHYQQVSIDNALSSKLLDSYLSDLDPARSYFLASDIQAFESYREQLDDLLGSGGVEPAFAIFRRFKQRATERLEFLLACLDRGIDDISFDIAESIDIEREDALWPADVNELNELSRKNLKNSILNLKLADKALDEIPEILVKRYENQLTSVSQTKSEDVFELYMNALAQQFDPHTSYFSPRAAENFDISMSQSLEGIGALLRTESEYTVIVSLITAGPAEKSQLLKPADRIAGVGQGAEGEIVDVVGWRIDDVVKLIRGPKKTIVRLEIIPADALDDESKVITLVRDTVKLEEQTAKKEIITVERQERSAQIAVIALPTFYLDYKALHAGDRNYRSSTRDVKRLLRELSRSDIEGLVIDLRNNSGGLLQEAIEVTGLFIEQGPIVQVRGADGSINILRDPDKGIYYRGPLAILTNRLSASASEICAGAIQDYGRGIVIGEPTFGKGTVQSIMQLNRGQLKATVAKFYRISGESTQNKGTSPDFAYPSLYDREKIGESALKNALPWDRIAKAKYQSFDDLSPVMDSLRKDHQRRQQGNPDYQYRLATIEYLEEVRKETTVSLNETVRREERDENKQRRLELENSRRRKLGLEPIAKLSELESETTVSPHGNKDEKAQDDPVLIDAAHVLLDYIRLSNNDTEQQ
jgi:carboxyl-terminal processing protease